MEKKENMLEKGRSLKDTLNQWLLKKEDAAVLFQEWI